MSFAKDIREEVADWLKNSGLLNDVYIDTVIEPEDDRDWETLADLATMKNKNGVVLVSYQGSKFEKAGKSRRFHRRPQILILAYSKFTDNKSNYWGCHDLLETCQGILYNNGIDPLSDDYLPPLDTHKRLYVGIGHFIYNSVKLYEN